MRKTIHCEDLPTAERILEAVKVMNKGNYFIWSANGDWVATGAYIDARGRLCLKMVSAECVDWRRKQTEDGE